MGILLQAATQAVTTAVDTANSIMPHQLKNYLF